MTEFINPHTRHGGAKRVVVADRRSRPAVHEAPIDDGLYLRQNGEWVLLEIDLTLDDLTGVSVAGPSSGATIVFDGVQWVDQPKVETSWAAPAMTNSWVDYGTAQGPPCGYRKAADGNVEIRGLIKSGTGVVFTLPSGFRPEYSMRFLCRSGSGYARVDITPAGTVNVVGYADGGSNTDVALDSIRFDPS